MKGYDCTLNQVASHIRVNCGSAFLAVIWWHPLAFLTAETYWLHRHSPVFFTSSFRNALDTARQEIDSLTSVLLRHDPSATVLSTYCMAPRNTPISMDARHIPPLFCQPQTLKTHVLNRKRLHSLPLARSSNVTTALDFSFHWTHVS